MYKVFCIINEKGEVLFTDNKSLNVKELKENLKERIFSVNKKGNKVTIITNNLTVLSIEIIKTLDKEHINIIMRNDIEIIAKNNIIIFEVTESNLMYINNKLFIDDNIFNVDNPLYYELLGYLKSDYSVIEEVQQI